MALPMIVAPLIAGSPKDTTTVPCAYCKALTIRGLQEYRHRTVARCGPTLWLAVDDPPGRDSLRGYIERNSIALLSNLGRPPLDPPSAAWRGRLCDRGKARVRDSGLWNQNHVDEDYDAGFLDLLEKLVNATKAPA